LHEPIKITAMEHEIFFVRLNEKGAAHLNKFYRLSKVLFSLSLLISVLTLAHLAIFLSNPLFSPERITDPNIRMEVYGSTAYAFIFSLVFPCQVYCYYRFGMRNKKGVEAHSVEAFNDSFRWLYLNAAVSMGSFALNFIYVSFTVYIELILSKKI
jgi:hypothetical protein